MKYKVCDKVGLPCARLLSIRQYPTCSPSKPWCAGFKPRRSRFGSEARAGSRSLERKVIITVGIMYTVHYEDRQRSERGGDSETSIRLIIRDANVLLEDPSASSRSS